jgi:hypothetical protein
MPAILVCPRCGMVGTAQADRYPVEIRYDYAQWRRQCRSSTADGPATCLGLASALQDLVSGAGEPAAVALDNTRDARVPLH